MRYTLLVNWRPEEPKHGHISKPHWACCMLMCTSCPDCFVVTSLLHA